MLRSPTDKNVRIQVVKGLICFGDLKWKCNKSILLLKSDKNSHSYSSRVIQLICIRHVNGALWWLQPAVAFITATASLIC